MRYIATAVALCAFGCSSSAGQTGDPPTPGSQDPGLDKPTTPTNNIPVCEKNFYTDKETCYPSDDIGMKYRGAMSSTVPGQRIQNLHFTGWLHTDPTVKIAPGSTPAKPFSLADFYDPEGREFSIIHMSVSAEWCGPCNQETDAMAAGIVANTKPAKIAWIQLISDNYVVGKPASISDLSAWITKKGSNFTTAGDPVGQQLGLYWTSGLGVPWNVNIDARSMELLDNMNGFDSGGLQAEVEAWADWQNTHPAK